MSGQGRVGDGAPSEAQAQDEQLAREAAERSYVEGILARGEAAEADEHGRLPPGATHEIVEWREGELPKLRRRRFSAR